MPLQRRLPKVGFRSKMKQDISEVLLYKLDSVKGDTIDFAALKAAGLVETRASRAKIVKKGELKRAVKVKGVAATAGARAAIEAAGGSVE
jgi:large subunit ribosomal protein L15